MMCSIVKVQVRGAGRCGRSFLLQNGGRKVMGEGCSYASLCHLCTECPPLHYNINIYAVVPDRVAPGERPFPAPPRAQPETQKRCRVQRTQHRLISQSITHQPYFPFVSALEKGADSGYNKTVVQSQDCCVEWHRHSS